jgi:hypothetical protein
MFATSWIRKAENRRICKFAEEQFAEERLWNGQHTAYQPPNRATIGRLKHRRREGLESLLAGSSIRGGTRDTIQSSIDGTNGGWAPVRFRRAMANRIALASRLM